MSTEVRQIVRKHTKQEYPDERDQVVARFFEERRPYFEEREDTDAKIEHLTEENQSLLAANEELGAKIAFLEEESERRKDSVLHKVIQVFTKHPYGDPYLRKRRRESTRLKIHLEGNQYLIRRNKKKLVKLRQTEVDTTPLERAEAAVGQFYKEHARNFLTPDQKKELFDPDFLAKLDLKEFMTLWRAGSPYYLSHVSRHGFRDHMSKNAMLGHNAGLGEFTGGFTSLLKSGEMKPGLSLQGLDKVNEETIEAFLKDKGILDMESKEDALEQFEGILKIGGVAPEYPDQTAVHLAAETVLDNYYGGESHNEVMVIFPADYIASQTYFAFHGWHKDFTQPQNESKWNDIFVWGEVPLDAGVVFLPENTPVDPETGSKYQSQIVETEEGRERVKVEDPNARDKVLTWWQNNRDILKELYQEWEDEEGSEYSYNRQRKYHRYEQKLLISLQEAGVYGSVETSMIDMVNDLLDSGIDSLGNKQIERLIDLCQIRYLAQDPVSSKKFWEEYFSRHPDSKPQRIVYYEGSLELAVKGFLQSHGLVKDKEDEPLLGFEKNHIVDMAQDPRSNQGKGEFELLSRQIIERHYSTQNNPQS